MIAVVATAFLAFAAGLVVGYRLKSAAAHNAARRTRLERTRRRAAEQLAELPPRVSTADISVRDEYQSRTSG